MVSQVNFSRRIYALDGLRGLAALVVVIHHHFLTIPWFSQRELNPVPPFEYPRNFSDYRFLLEYTPLRLIHSGSEAVVLFFVISGYVLIFSLENNFASYVRRRLFRLYIPILGSLLLAVLLLLFFPRQTNQLNSDWVNSQVFKISNLELMRDIWVLDGSTKLASHLWSMRLEILFSLFIMIFAGIKFKTDSRLFLCFVSLMFALIFSGSETSLSLLNYLPIFIAGTCLHMLRKTKRFVYFRLILGVNILISFWYFAAFGIHLNLGSHNLLMTIGALIIVDVCRSDSNKIICFLESKRIQILGKYSYSLYLVHLPILLSVWFRFGTPMGLSDFIVQVTLSTILIIIFTKGIYILFELPALKYSRKV